MKKLMLSLTLSIASTGYAVQEENPYHTHLEQRAHTFSQNLSPESMQGCLNFFLGNKPQEMPWAKDLGTLMREITARFIEVCQTALRSGAIDWDNMEHYSDEFGVYTLLSLYRVIYEQALEKNMDPAFLTILAQDGITPSPHPLPTPDELESECAKTMNGQYLK